MLIKLLIDIGAGLSILKPITCKRFTDRFPGNVIIQGITDQKMPINESTLVPFDVSDPHKVVYICNLYEFDGLLGSDLLELQQNTINYKLHSYRRIDSFR